MSNLYTVFMVCEAAPGKEAELRESLLELREKSLAEPGCMSYYVYHDFDNPARFLLYQNWINRKMQEEHSLSPHVRKWMKERHNLLAEPYKSSFWQIIK